MPLNVTKILWQELKLEFISGFLPLIRGGIGTLTNLWRTHGDEIKDFFRALPQRALNGLAGIADGLQVLWTTWQPRLAAIWDGFLAGGNAAITLLNRLSGTRAGEWAFGGPMAQIPLVPTGQGLGGGGGGGWQRTRARGAPGGDERAGTEGGGGGALGWGLEHPVGAAALGLGGYALLRGAGGLLTRPGVPSAIGRGGLNVARAGLGMAGRGAAVTSALAGESGGAVATSIAGAGGVGGAIASVGAMIAAAVGTALVGWGIGTWISKATSPARREADEINRETAIKEGEFEKRKDDARERGYTLREDVAEEMGLRKKWEGGKLSPEESERLETEYRRQTRESPPERPIRDEIAGAGGERRWGDWFRDASKLVEKAAVEERPLEIKGEVTVRNEVDVRPTDQFTAQLAEYEILQTWRGIQAALA